MPDFVHFSRGVGRPGVPCVPPLRPSGAKSVPLGGRAGTFPARGPRSRRPAARYGARTVGRLLYWRPLGYGHGSPRCGMVSIDPQGVGVALPRGAISKPPPWVEISMATSGVSSVCLMLRGGELAQSAKKEGMSRGVDRLFHQASAPCQVCVQILCTARWRRWRLVQLTPSSGC